MDEHEWDALVSDENFYNSYRWLRALEHAFGETDVLTVRGPAGLVAGCTLWEGEPSSGMFFLPDYTADVPGPWQQRFLWLGGRRNTHNEIPCIQGKRRQKALAELGRFASNYALERGYAGFVMPYMPYGAAVEFADAVDGTVILHSAEAYVEVPDTGLGGAMETWRSRDRGDTESEIAAFRQVGNRVEWIRGEQLDDLLAADLITQNRSRYGSTQGRPWMQKILEGQRMAGVSRLSTAVLSKRQDDITAMTIFYRFGNVLHARYFGADYSLGLADYRYFVLSYYEPLDYAAANGLTKLGLSISALRAKVKRGAKIGPQAFVAKCVDRQHICSSGANQHNRRAVRQYQKEFKRHLGPEWELAETHQNPTS